MLHLLCDVPVSDVDLEYAGIKRARLGQVALCLGDRAEIIQDLPGTLSGLGNPLEGAGVLVLGQVEKALLLPATGQQAAGLGGQPGVLEGLLELGSGLVVGFLSQEGLPELEAVANEIDLAMDVYENDPVAHDQGVKVFEAGGGRHGRHADGRKMSEL